MQIRPEEERDHRAIASVVAEAFGSQRQVQLVAAIRESPHFIPELSLVADVDGTVVGHVMVSSVLLRDDEAERVIHTLSPLAVGSEHQRRGIGSSLVRQVVTRADDLGVPLIVLEGDPAYYRRFGFEPASRHGIEIPLPAWAPPDAAQVRLLTRYEPSLRGRVVYPPAFADH